MVYYTSILLSLSFFALAFGDPVKIVTHSNKEVWKDSTTDEMLDAHDGNILGPIDGFYYMFAMGYTDCKLEKGVIPPRDCPGIYRKYGTGCGFRTGEFGRERERE